MLFVINNFVLKNFPSFNMLNKKSETKLIYQWKTRMKMKKIAVNLNLWNNFQV